VRRHILVALVLLLLVSLQVAYADECEATVIPGYPSLPSTVQYPPECTIVYGNYSIVLYCPHSTVFSESGLYIFVNHTQFNGVVVYALSDYILLAIYDNPEVEKPLSTIITCYELGCAPKPIRNDIRILGYI